MSASAEAKADWDIMSTGIPHEGADGQMTQLTDSLGMLRQALAQMPRPELARMLEVSTKTIVRWQREEVQPPVMLAFALRQILAERTSQVRQGEFTTADLFAGIGGIRMAFEAAGGRCVFTSEWNKFSQQTYRENFSDAHPLTGDITTVEPADMPHFDVLLAGFPCQPFSIAGVSKKNALGVPHGFACEAQGTLFFDVARIIAAKKPRAFLLENVKNLVGHDQGRTFKVIRNVLENELGYHLHYRVIDGQHFVPQHRERIILVGFREKCAFEWDDVRLPDKRKQSLEAILHPEDGSELAEEPYTLGKKAKVNSKYTLTDHLWRYLQDYSAKHRAAGNGFGFGLVRPKDIARTLSARYYKDGSEILVWQGRGRNPRRLTPRECARLMGYPDSFRIPVSDTQAYRQFGNSVVVPVITAVAQAMRPHILQVGERTHHG